MRRGCLRFISLLLGVTQYEFPLRTGAVLIAARVARALHTTSLSDYVLLFYVLTNILNFFEMRNHTAPPSPKKKTKNTWSPSAGIFRDGPCGVLLGGGSQIWLKTTEKSVFL